MSFLLRSPVHAEEFVSCGGLDHLNFYIRSIHRYTDPLPSHQNRYALEQALELLHMSIPLPDAPHPPPRTSVHRRESQMVSVQDEDGSCAAKQLPATLEDHVESAISDRTFSAIPHPSSTLDSPPHARVSASQDADSCQNDIAPVSPRPTMRPLDWKSKTLQDIKTGDPNFGSKSRKNDVGSSDASRRLQRTTTFARVQSSQTRTSQRSNGGIEDENNEQKSSALDTGLSPEVCTTPIAISPAQSQTPTLRVQSVDQTDFEKLTQVRIDLNTSNNDVAHPSRPVVAHLHQSDIQLSAQMKIDDPFSHCRVSETEADIHPIVNSPLTAKTNDLAPSDPNSILEPVGESTACALSSDAMSQRGHPELSSDRTQKELSPRVSASQAVCRKPRFPAPPPRKRSAFCHSVSSRTCETDISTVAGEDMHKNEYIHDRRQSSMQAQHHRGGQTKFGYVSDDSEQHEYLEKYFDEDAVVRVAPDVQRSVVNREEVADVQNFDGKLLARSFVLLSFLFERQNLMFKRIMSRGTCLLSLQEKLIESHFYVISGSIV